MTSINWDAELTKMSSNDVFTKFHDTIIEIIDCHAPLRSVETKHKKNPNPWITKGIINSCQRLRLSYKITLLPTCTDVEQADYRSYRNKTKKAE